MDEKETRYLIDLKWYEENERSFPLQVQTRLCPSCREKIATGLKEHWELFAAFRDCCSKQDSFFSPKLPLKEMIFRLFLANGNQPLYSKEIRDKLKEWLIRTGDTRDVSVPRLKRIIDNDFYYGVRPLPAGT